MRRLFVLLVVVAAFFAGGYVFALRGEKTSVDTTTTSSIAPSTSSTSTSTTTTAKAVLPCASDLLIASLTPTGGGLGSATFAVSLQNTGGAPCTVRGYLSLQLRDVNGVALPTTVVPTTSGFSDPRANRAPTLVTLGVGSKASSAGVYPTVPAGSERTCAIASSISILVPGTSTPLVVPTSISPCARGLIRLSPLFPS